MQVRASMHACMHTHEHTILRTPDNSFFHRRVDMTLVVQRWITDNVTQMKYADEYFLVMIFILLDLKKF